MHKPKYKLITFYKFVNIPENELKQVAQEHLDFCRDIGLKGRIYIGTEGISSTVTGNIWQTKAYKWYLDNSKYFQNIEGFDHKASDVDGHKFPRMSVKIREEIVKLGVKVTEEEIKKYDKRLTPDEVKRIIDEEDENYLILDMRNDYEYRLGHFKGAIPAGTVNFREVPKLLEKYGEKAKGKKILWYCTGGIRCEKASVLANMKGDTEYYAIEGGIMGYINKHNDGNWLGNLYTFDDRVSTFVGDEHTHITIGECCYSAKLTDNCENCRYSPCNARLIADKKEYKKHMGFCSEECLEKAKKDGLIKDMDFDSLNYQNLRNDSKNNPENKQKNLEKISKHLEENLAGVEFNHKFSQKEEEIIEA
ncbi:hypothetical protein DLH72_05195 [Candidatus Gracilibacteria bacterium]|nr:MAG: hypothetical protein DLH72_05195 [Candidatus Gracilibacteria bacterium]